MTATITDENRRRARILAQLTSEDIALALADTAAQARAEALEEAAKLLEQVADVKDASDIGERAADAFNEWPARAAMSDRLKAWNDVLASAIRTLASNTSAA